MMSVRLATRLVVDDEGEIIAFRRVPTTETIEAVLDGDEGHRLARVCAVCSRALVVGDRVFVTQSHFDNRAVLLHAISHAPDCVDALTRELGEQDARALAAEQAGNETARAAAIDTTRTTLVELDGARARSGGTR